MQRNSFKHLPRFSWQIASLSSILCNHYIRIATWENVPSDVCAHLGLRSVCFSAQTYQNLRCPYEGTLHLWLSRNMPMKILIRLRECAADLNFCWAVMSECTFSDIEAIMLEDLFVSPFNMQRPICVIHYYQNFTYMYFLLSWGLNLYNNNFQSHLWKYGYFLTIIN